MRIAWTLLALAGLVAAQDAERPAGTMKLEDGRLTESYWNFVYRAPGLQEGFGFGGPTAVFEGTCDGGLRITITVHELSEKIGAKEVRERVKKLWAKEKRKLEDVVENDDAAASMLFVRESLAGFRRHHGYAWHMRGYHCIEVHAEVDEKTETSGEALRKAIFGIELGEDEGALLGAYVVAKQMKKPVDHPLVVLRAAIGYAERGGGIPQHYVFAQSLFARAREHDAKEGTYNPGQRWRLYELGGLSILSKPTHDGERAIEWHRKAEAIAKDHPGAGSAGQSAYNLACAYSLAGKLDQAFDALGRAYTYDPKVVEPSHLKSDPDLENMRADPRWEEFVAERVAGRSTRPQ